jgi:hypothetical protein
VDFVPTRRAEIHSIKINDQHRPGRLLQAGPRECLSAHEQAFGPSRALAHMNSNRCFLSFMLFSKKNLMNNVIL